MVELTSTNVHLLKNLVSNVNNLIDVLITAESIPGKSVYWISSVRKNIIELEKIVQDIDYSSGALNYKQES